MKNDVHGEIDDKALPKSLRALVLLTAQLAAAPGPVEEQHGNEVKGMTWNRQRRSTLAQRMSISSLECYDSPAAPGCLKPLDSSGTHTSHEKRATFSRIDSNGGCSSEDAK